MMISTTSSTIWSPKTNAISFIPSRVAPKINWTGAAQFRNQPKVTYNGFLPAKGIFTIESISENYQETLINLEDGFTYNGVRLQYLSTPEDVGKAVYIQWILERPFQESTGDFVTSSYIKGKLQLPTHSSATLRLVTQELGRDVSTAIVRTGFYKTLQTEETLAITPKPVSKLYKHINVNTNTFLRQIVTVAMVIGVANQKFILELSLSAESTLSNSITSESPSILDADIAF